ncbi:hypothetical protein [Microbacterium sp. TNHR37B]|uniref:hypothetical protein n=1 Tax=Microbacterium sp. TNHR37B TaxID=1775956 RepID=UPI0007B2E0AC|nr:hypothetical protein [Microbacterium sp. TNHR37B]KZE88950.1 hypothetical protein AVP41_01741 [Microbacterium sp. TNHR37B]
MTSRLRVRPLLALFVVGGLALGGCAATDPVSVPAAASAGDCPPTPIDVTIDSEVEITEAGVILHAATNLPEGTLLGAAMFREESGGFQSQDEVSGGAATFGPLQDDDGGTLRGDYQVVITMAPIDDQPAAVRACIGADGENLSGDLVTVEAVSGRAGIVAFSSLSLGDGSDS